MSQRVFVIYAWGSVALWFFLILILGLVPNLDVTGNQIDWLARSLGYSLLYGIMFLLLFRAMLATTRAKVSRLMYYKSKREKIEDSEFAYLTEFLLFLVAVLVTLLLSILDEYIQSGVEGRIGAVVDVLVNILGVAFTTALIFKVPLITELEEILFKKNPKKK